MRDYFDANLSWDDYTSRRAALSENAARFDAKEARTKALAAEAFDTERLRRYAVLYPPELLLRQRELLIAGPAAQYQAP